MRRGFWFAAMALFVLAGTALATVGKEPIRNLPVRGGPNDPAITVPVAPDRGPVVRPALDLIGTTYDAGTTYYDYQHNGSSGKMISVDDLGYVHLVWMNGLTATLAGPRHVYYNVWDPSTQSFVFGSAGQQVNTSNRAGYASQATLPSGWCFPAFHQIVSGDANPHTAAAMDFLPTVAAFTTTMPAWLYEDNASLSIIWPHASIGPDSAIHVAACESPASGAAGDPQRVYYSRGRPTWDTDGYGIQVEWDAVSGSDEFKLIDTVMVIAPVTAASLTSNRVAYVWVDTRDTLASASQYNNDLWVVISEDGGLNWGTPINVTNFIPPDWDCPSQDTLVCDKDTNRVYEDCNAIFDRNDYLHVAFTTSYYYSLEGLINTWFSDVWHWGEQFEEFTPICHGGFDSTTWTQAPGAWQREVHRPNLAEDPVTGYLYCSYQRYDSMHISEAGYPQGDAFVSVSCNGGRSWSVATNVTETGDVEGAPAGQCQSERDITLNGLVTYVNGEGYLHMEYVLDLDAGGIPQDEGSATLNPVMYQRIPVNQIPLTPINDPYYPLLHIDSTGMPGRITPLDPNECWSSAVDDGRALRPETFRLYQNYPNPFNPTTHIQFDLVRDARVTLTVYNVLGETVATLLDGRMMSAGAQTVRFDGSNLASGVYLYRLDVEGVSASLKMVLMK